MLRRIRRQLDDALADVASGVAHGLETRADIAVTGLRGAGKTVFLTALMHHLARAAEGGPGLAGLAAAPDRRLGTLDAHYAAIHCTYYDGGGCHHHHNH